MRVRGVDAVLQGGDRRGPCPPQLLQAVLAAVAERNHIRTHPAVERVLRRVGGGAPPPAMLWETRWTSKRERVAGVVACSDSSDDSDGEVGGGGMGNKFIPFGSVVAASGCSVRITCACSAGLAAELPLYGLRMRGDAEWAVKAVKPAGTHGVANTLLARGSPTTNLAYPHAASRLI